MGKFSYLLEQVRKGENELLYTAGRRYRQLIRMKNGCKKRQTEKFNNELIRPRSRDKTYEAAIAVATPRWADVDKMFELYMEMYTKNRSGKIKYAVDHIIPIKGDLVSGLNNEFNLQILTAKENKFKGRYYNVED